MTLLTAADRTLVRQAIDNARRAQVEAAGGYTAIEREDRRRDREAGCDPFDSDAQAARIAELEEQVRELRRRLQRAHEKAARARASRDRYKKKPRRGWWHEEARQLRAQGLSYPEIGRRFGVDHTSVMYAVRQESKERRDAASRERRLRAVA